MKAKVHSFSMILKINYSLIKFHECNKYFLLMIDIRLYIIKQQTRYEIILFFDLEKKSPFCNKGFKRLKKY